MIILFWNLIIFFVALFVHFIIWKLCLPRHHTDTLLKIFVIVLALGIFLIRYFEVFSLFDYLRLSLLYMSLSLAYTISYSAVEADSPSLLITLKIADSKKKGLLKRELEACLTDDNLVLPRLNDLVRDALVTYKYGIYQLTQKGDMFVKIFIFFRKLLGATKGG